ncbi:hypothetical protein [Amycolatopsis benzoatilytica]|uniref:hypothetical protein n=1 Tax=Amycolatopsis benzoatilytica TaxID=346045 RepID=UPI000370C07E|nr:hypothetical protein [Amycolatopsis benzoatilytica]
MSESVSESADVDERPSRGLGIASVSVAAVSLVLAGSTWMAWLLVRPRVIGGEIYPLVAQVFVLVLGALWFVALLAGVLALVLGVTGGARRRYGGRGGDLARIGALLGALTFVVALAGAVAFTIQPDATPVFAGHADYLGR